MLSILIISSIILLSSSFMALLESSILVTDELKLSYLIQKNKDKFSERKKKIIQNIILKKDRYLSSMAFISTSVNVIGSGIIGALVSNTLGAQETTIFTACYIYFILVFQRILPKVIAVEKFSFFLNWFAYLINIFYYITTPILIVTSFWIKIFKPKKNKLSIRELKSIIHYYTEKGAIHSMEESMIDQLLSIKKKTVADLIKNNEPIIKLNYSSKLKKYRSRIIESKSKIYAVHKNNEIVGIAFYRDIADLLLNENDTKNRVSECLKTAFFINSNEDAFDAILKFKKNKDAYAIVVNNDNDVVGIVSAKQVYTYALRN
jgi:CBS domain containing-hemolysin-like protein